MAEKNHTGDDRPSDVLLEQALERAARKARTEPAVPRREPDPRDRVFPGNMPAPARPDTGETPRRMPRPARRKVSPFTVVVGLILTAVASVLYISNVLAVSRLAAEIGTMEEEYRTILNEQEMIRAQIARLSGLERIRRIAEDEYGMRYSEAVPGWLSVDENRIAELRRLSERAGTQDHQ